MGFRETPNEHEGDRHEGIKALDNIRLPYAGWPI